MYTIFGYNDLCIDFSYTFDKFTDAVKKYQELDMDCITFIMREQPGTCLYIR